jgi:hypothetical protein
MKKCLLLILFYFFIQHLYGDSLTVVFQGIKKGEKYKVFYKGDFVKLIKSKKHYKYSNDSFRISVLGLQDGNGLGIEIYRKGKCGLFYRDTYFGTFYDSSKKYLIVYRDEKLKSRYAISPIWSNKLIRTR